MTRAHLYCESYKTMNTTNIKECYCVAKKKLIRGEKTKPQRAMVITLWFWGFRSCMCTEQYGDWSLHNQRFSGINDFLSLTAKLLKTFSLRYWWFTQYCIKLLFMEAHGGVLDCHFSWTNLVIYVFYPGPVKWLILVCFDVNPSVV